MLPQSRAFVDQHGLPDCSWLGEKGSPSEAEIHATTERKELIGAGNEVDHKYSDVASFRYGFGLH